MSLRTSALTHFIQNKLYLQYIFILILDEYFLSFFEVILSRKAYRCKTALNKLKTDEDT